MQHECPRCHDSLNSQNAVNLHMLGEEGCYKDGERIADTIRERIDTLKGQVHYLLILKPSTAGDDNFLEGYFNVLIAHTHYYDPQLQAFREKQGIPLSKLKFKVKSGSLSRLRRYIQEEDRQLYHKREGNGYSDEWKAQHDCTLPSRQTELRKSIEADISRKEWARR